MIVCKHCGQPIIHRAGLEWRHLDQNTIYCDRANWRTCTLATPKENTR